MNKLRVSAYNLVASLEPPKDDKEFERLCLDVFGLIEKERGVEIINKHKANYTVVYGKKGDKQNGVDLKDYATYATAQCKNVEKFGLSELNEEIRKLKGYEEPISYHFFLISLNEITINVQKRVEENNNDILKAWQVSQPHPAKPSVCLPYMYIFNWEEIKSIMLKDTHISIKWGLLPAVASKYPYLVGFNIDKASKAVNDLDKKLTINSYSMDEEVIHALRAMTKQMVIGEIEKIGSEPEILSETILSISAFVLEIDKLFNMAKNFKEAVDDCMSRDTITLHRGLEHLNLISLHLTRIMALPYLGNMYDSASVLLDILNKDSLYQPGMMDVEDDHGDCISVDNEKVRVYNFHDIDCMFHEYVDSKYVSLKAAGLVRDLKCIQSVLET